MDSLGRKIGSVNIDSPSFHYHGKERMFHEDNTEVNYDDPHKISVTFGYSRDAHPELVQVMEQMMVDNAPVFLFTWNLKVAIPMTRTLLAEIRF